MAAGGGGAAINEGRDGEVAGARQLHTDMVAKNSVAVDQQQADGHDDTGFAAVTRGDGAKINRSIASAKGWVGSAKAVRAVK